MQTFRHAQLITSSPYQLYQWINNILLDSVRTQKNGKYREKIIFIKKRKYEQIPSAPNWSVDKTLLCRNHDLSTDIRLSTAYFC